MGILTCSDGTEWNITLPGGPSSNWGKCGRRKGRLRCPSTWPYMCVDRFCKQDPTDCFTADSGHGGLLSCSVTDLSIKEEEEEAEKEEAEEHIPGINVLTRLPPRENIIANVSSVNTFVQNNINKEGMEKKKKKVNKTEGNKWDEYED